MEAGYTTAGFVSGYPLIGGIGFRDAFNEYDDNMSDQGFPRAFGSTLASSLMPDQLDDVSHWRRAAEATSGVAMRWFDQNHDKPYFAWIHYYDPHLPYLQQTVDGPTDGRWYALNEEEKRAVATSAERMQHMRSLYDAQITYADMWLGRTIEAARRAAPGDLWIVVTADHGESIDEHDIYFLRDSYEVTSRVPLIIVPPAHSKFLLGQRDELVGTIDIAPTVLAAAGFETKIEMTGVDLARRPGERLFFRTHMTHGSEGAPSVSVRSSTHRLIEREFGREGQYFRPSSRELYHVVNDPGELANLAGTGLESERLLLQELEATGLIEALGDREAPIFDAEAEEALRALGYLE
jgi:arylsulfatase A-like enzyme